MKIIEGKFSDKHITYRAREGQRVTGEKVRKAVFDMLKQYIDFNGASIADVFAGSGIYGFEAMSRGGALCTFVDNSREGIKYIKETIEYFGLKNTTTPLCTTWDRFISQNTTEFNIVFLDPPYFDFDFEKLSGVDALVKSGGIVVIESSKKIKLPVMAESMIQLETRTYGDVRVDFFRKK
ncbi:MAG: RsmD family RNA methyltransferase [Patescibacteria group bacterium]